MFDFRLKTSEKCPQESILRPGESRSIAFASARETRSWKAPRPDRAPEARVAS